ncbi:hypothetical protein Poli38472_007933 [Pythium oligandrum]|uniref:PhoD-like phosphatase metallophosphatase domain-containing protein n=1 Tax=Pythium oligandrum TaxID=41045 RepID=A0A8K1CMB4_PYTOL|nr:hypothetical protein Poli38472_007933 [Pythium oligandrum]|eukprot:TMW65291.1 hypothetical protein Poli38472_007933 [Pythium oligandrum]
MASGGVDTRKSAAGTTPNQVAEGMETAQDHAFTQHDSTWKPTERLTPKQRWMQSWRAELAQLEATEQPPQVDGAKDSQTTEESTTTVVEPDLPMQESAAFQSTQREHVPLTDDNIQPHSDAEPGEVITPSSTTLQTLSKPTITTVSAESTRAPQPELRLRTPKFADSTHLSPPGDRPNATPPPSISPTAKLKETDTSALSGSKSDSKSESAKAKELATDPIRSELSLKRKQSTDEEEIVLTESERQRLERRKKKKSNWDVEDPNSTSVVLAPSSTAPATNPLSFATFPRGRPVWRHSHSMDAKDTYYHRHSFSGSSPPYPPGRRSLHHSNSLPLERSRSTGRPYSRSFSGSSYRARCRHFHVIECKSTSPSTAHMRILTRALWLSACVLWLGGARKASASVLLAVGDVTATGARILYDKIPSTASLVHVHVHRLSQALQADQILEIELTENKETDRPGVIHVQDLTPDTQYQVAFQFSSTDEHEIVHFRTSMSESVANRVLVVSCDRYVDDHDDELWLKIADDVKANAESHFGMAHIGDQVYMDAGSAAIPINPVPLTILDDHNALQAHYDVIVKAYRSIYRETFGRAAVQRVLRRGAHWMIPDDHEVINNVNIEAVMRVFAPFSTTEDGAASAKRLALQLHYRAGLQTLYEYQYQLQYDIDWRQVNFLTGSLSTILQTYPLYHPTEIGRLKLFFLDVRFDRSFLRETERDRIISETQIQTLRRQLTTWDEDEKNTVVVLASMPLFFHSSTSAAIAYGVEKELYPGHDDQRRGLLDLYAALRSSDATLRLLVGGDVHMLAHTRVCGNRLNSTKCFDQLITSGVTTGSTAITDSKLLPFYYFITRLYPVWDSVRSLVWTPATPWHVEADRVFFGRNYGVLALGADGGFEWRNSVTIPHDSRIKTVTQGLLNSLEPQVVLAVLAAVWLQRWLVGRRGT